MKDQVLSEAIVYVMGKAGRYKMKLEAERKKKVCLSLSLFPFLKEVVSLKRHLGNYNAAMMVDYLWYDTNSLGNSAQ